MLYVFTGSDREKARAAMTKAVAKLAGKESDIVRITDANSLADLKSVLQGGGMFGGKRVIVFENVVANPEMNPVVLEALPHLKKSEEGFFIYEEKPDAATRKQLEKYAEKSERFDVVKAKRDVGIFAMANALRSGDKKSLWVDYQRARARDDAPEAIHGILFWGAKQAFLAAGSEKTRKMVADLAELPHEARRTGVELEYALERFILSVNK